MASSAAHGLRRHSPSFDGDFGLEDLFQEYFDSEEKDVDVKTGSESSFRIDPSFWDLFAFDDEEETAEEESERLKREAEEKKREAEEKKRKEEESAWRRKKHNSVIESIREYEPKAKMHVWTRFPFEQFSFFDIDEESPVPPMRHAGKKYQTEDQIGHMILCSANILSIKIVSSDVGYPINVYGTVIARDSLDHKCIYLFRCNRMDSLLINSENESLILIGPSRGVVLMDFIYLEVDLKIKGEQGQDKQLSKTLLEIDGRVVTRQRIEVRSISRPTRLSTVQVEYAVVEKAMEATIEFQVIKGYFFGEITAHTTSIPYEMLLYNSKRGGVVTSDGNGTIQLWRRVIAVCLKDMLKFTIVTQVSNDAAASVTQVSSNNSAPASTRKIDFTPRLSDADEYEFWCGRVMFYVKVTWSVIDHFY